MADPLSLATAVITITGMVATTAKFVKVLEEVRHFDRDVRKICRKFRVFAPLVEMVSMTLDHLCQRHPESAVVRYIAEKGLAAGLAEESWSIGVQIRMMKNQLEDAREGRFLGRLWWAFIHKPEIYKIYPEMEGLKLSLLLVQSTIQCDITSDKTEKKRLGRAMRHLEKALITVLEEHFSEAQTTSSTTAHPNRSVTSLALHTTELLLDLSISMRKTERVPDIVPAHVNTPPARETRRRPRSRRLETAREVPTTQQGQAPIYERSPSPQLRRTRPAPAHIPEEKASNRPEPRVLIPESTLRHFESKHPEANPTDPEEAHVESMVSRQSTLLTRATSASSSAGPVMAESPTTPISPAAITLAPAESSFIDVRETKNHHSLIGLRGEAVQGVIGKTGFPKVLKQYVTARRYGTALGENFICLRMAQELGLDIIDLDSLAEDDESKQDPMVLVVCEGGKPVEKRAVGTVETRWWTVRPPGWRLVMWVVEGNLPDGVSIALGRPFEMRKRHYDDGVGRAG